MLPDNARAKAIFRENEDCIHTIGKHDRNLEGFWTILETWQVRTKLRTKVVEPSTLYHARYSRTFQCNFQIRWFPFESDLKKKR